MVVRVVLFGLGGSANALERLIALSREGKDSGLWHPRVGGAAASELELVGGFDLDKTVLSSGGEFQKLPGLAVDAPPAHLSGRDVETGTEDRVRLQLREMKPDVGLNLISSGQPKSSLAYAKLCAEEGVAFANATSSAVAQDTDAVSMFVSKRVPLAGDDLMSQLGGTALHRGLIEFFQSRGVKVSRSYQLDVGGGPDTLNTLDEEIRAQKREIKSVAIASEAGGEMRTVAGTTDYVEFLGSRRTVYLWLEAFGALGEPYTLDIFFKSSDPANSANMLADVARALYRDRTQGKGGPSGVLCSYAFKNPPKAKGVQDSLAAFLSTYT